MSGLLSFSKIATWLRCPKLFSWRYVERAEPEQVSMALLQGQAVHDALGAEAQRRVEDQEGGFDYALAAYREMLTLKVSSPEAPVDLGKLTLQEHFDQGEGLIRAYFDHGEVQQILEVEKDFELYLEEGFGLTGVIDFVVDGESGPEVVELKTSSRSWSDLQVELSPQASIYALALGAEEEPVPVTYQVLVKTKQAKVQEIRTYRDSDSCQLVRETLVEVSEAIEAGCFPRNCSVQNCSSCAYRAQCLGGGAG